ncbi:MAG: tyrosine-type recombinase/integrase [Alphaproteobacteria bacterium]
MRFTQRSIEALRCPEGRKDALYFDEIQKGLAVRVTATGGRSYLAQYTLAGQKRRVPLGSCSAVTLATAREAAQAIMGDVAKAIDPAAQRKTLRAAAARASLSLGDLVDTWCKLHLARKRSRYSEEAVRALRRAFTREWSAPAESLTRSAVVRALDALTRADKVAMAGRTAAYGRACFTWANRRGTIDVNPFSKLPSAGARPKRERVLTDAELADVWRAAEGTPGPFGTVVRLLILTGQRREEVAGMAWAETSADRTTWTIAAARTKNGVAHVVPLAPLASDIVRNLAALGPLVMPGDTGGPFNGWSRAKARLDERIAAARAKAAGVALADEMDLSAYAIPAWTLHDLRRTLATGLQRLGVRLEVTEAVLNHVGGSRAGIVGIYQRHDWQVEKRAALEAWAQHVAAVVAGQPLADNVVPLAGRR